jgi:hypothetical protein
VLAALLGVATTHQKVHCNGNMNYVVLLNLALAALLGVATAASVKMATVVWLLPTCCDEPTALPHALCSLQRCWVC